MQKALPVVGQLDRGLHLSPQRLRSHKTIEVKRVFLRAHVVHGPAELVGAHRERCGFTRVVCQFRKILFAGLTLADKKHGRFGKRPA